MTTLTIILLLALLAALAWALWLWRRQYRIVESVPPPSELFSPLFRAAQTGFTQNYALVMVLGLMLAVAAFFAKDIATAVRAIIATVF